MKAIDVIRRALDATDESSKPLVGGMGDAALTRPTEGAQGGGENRPLWCVGHQAFIEAGLRQILFGRANSLQVWVPTC